MGLVRIRQKTQNVDPEHPRSPHAVCKALGQIYNYGRRSRRKRFE